MAWTFSDQGLNERLAIHTGTWTGDNSISTTALDNVILQLASIKVHYDASITNNCTVTIDSVTGANYDTVITTFDNGSGATDNYAQYTEGDVVAPGDIIKVACNVGANNAYCTIICKVL
jgi:hypothetical protein